MLSFMKLKTLIKLCFVFKFLVLPLLLLVRFPFLFLLFYNFCFLFLFSFFFYMHGEPWLFSHSLGMRHRLAVGEPFPAHDGIWCLPGLKAVWPGWHPHLCAYRPPSQWGLLWLPYLKLHTPALWCFWSFFSCSVFSPKLFFPSEHFYYLVLI